MLRSTGYVGFPNTQAGGVGRPIATLVKDEDGMFIVGEERDYIFHPHHAPLNHVRRWRGAVHPRMNAMRQLSENCVKSRLAEGTPPP